MPALKSSRFFFLSMYVLPSKEGSIDRSTVQCLTKAHLLPAKIFLPEYLTEQAFAKYLIQKEASTLLAQKIAHTSFSVSLWSAQEQLLSTLHHALHTEQQKMPLQGLPPMDPALLQTHFTPSGNFWIGCQTIANSSLLAQRHCLAIEQALFKHTQSTPLQTQHWEPSMLLSEQWAMEAERQFGVQIELLGLS